MNVLFIGGTGTISSACVAESARQGLTVQVLNRGRTDAVPARLVEAQHLTRAALAPLSP